MKTLFKTLILTAAISTAAVNTIAQGEPTATTTQGAVDTIPSNAKIYTTKKYDKTAYFVVISKTSSPTVKVYAKDDKDTVLVASYSAVIGIGIGDKQIQGDHRTPEGTFTISSIENKKGVTFNYGAPSQAKWYPGAINKPVEAYGAWFCRLKGVANNGKNISNNGIGIHGSGGNEGCLSDSNKPLAPGHHKDRDSAGCIRLSNSGIIHFRNNYAFVGMKVIIKKEGQGPLSFEKEK